MNKLSAQKTFAIATLGLMLTGCLAGQNEQFFEPRDYLARSQICLENPNAQACSLMPAVTTPGVVTVLFTMSQIPRPSASMILVNAIKYASPVINPRVLFFKDSNTHGEDEGDSVYIKDKLLADYNVEYRVMAAGGITAADVVNKDLVIISNPGHPLTDAGTLTSLKNFTGGVILIGDDMSAGSSFSVASFTGLNPVSNGTNMSCNGHTYNYDNLTDYNYQVSLNDDFVPGIPNQYKDYQYGNDLDITTAQPGTQVLAWAAAAPGTCDIGFVPAIVRRPRN